MAVAAVLALVVQLAAVAGPAAAAPVAPAPTSASGITVHAWRWLTPGRTLEVDVSTPAVSPGAVVGGNHQVRVTLPQGYVDRPTTNFPVLYLLHGGGGGRSSDWTTGGDVENLTAGHDLITVMPEGGKVGWYTNWVDQSAGAQRWKDFHLDQLIGWVDANFRTNATKQGRAVAGLSMGGFGAIRYAQDRPDLFAFAASFSGAVDLRETGTRAVVTQQSIQYGMPAYGAFGSPFWPFDGRWNQTDPVGRAHRLQGVSVALYAGSGTNDLDVIERTMGASTHRLHQALDAAGVPHHYWMYGRPGPGSPYGCNGGHNYGCWNFALLDALPRMMAVLEVTTGPSTNAVTNGGFEAGLAGWTCLGGCGADVGPGFARTGAGNGWVRSSGGWNDVHQTVSVQPNTSYEVSGWVRTSANNSHGFFGLRTASGAVVGEQHVGRLDGYTRVSATVDTGANSSLVVFAGLWANGDTWLQVDDVSVREL